MRLKRFIDSPVLLVAALVVVVVCGSIARAQTAKLLPIDEAVKDPSFFVFRARLLKAIAKRELPYLISVLDPQIRTDFGGGGGVADFKKAWHPERPGSQIWNELATVLGLGGSFGNGSFSAPYVFSKFPEDLDAYEYRAVIDDGVRVRRERSTNSAIIRTLSFDIVKVISESAAESNSTKRAWVSVELSDGQKGYVAEEFLRSPIDYRAIFEQKNGKWVMTAFIAGD